MFVFADEFKGFSGYSKAIRELAFAMSKLTDVCLLENNTLGYIPDRIYHLIHRGMPKLEKDDFILARPFFNSAFSSLAERCSEPNSPRLIANIVLESSVPETIVKEVNKDSVYRIWTPSSFVKNICIKYGIIEDKIDVVPHGYNPDIFKVNKTKTLYDFLFVGGYVGKGDRKGADLLAKSFVDEFKLKERFILFKINSAYRQNEKELKLRNDMFIDTADLVDSEMVEIYESSKVFVNTSMAEGFNMALLEALACGLPVVTTSTGESDYLSDIADDRIMIIPSCFEIPAKHSLWDFGKWFLPSKEHIQVFMREALKEKKKKYDGIERWTWEEAAKKAIRCLE